MIAYAAELLICMKENGLIMLPILGYDLLPYEYNIIIATGMMSMVPGDVRLHYDHTSSGLASLRSYSLLWSQLLVGRQG